jgi:riboflavin kinase/FMN adenylyltransferase
MKIYRSLEAVPDLPRKTALAIGNFDGLHLGHRKILSLLVNEAADKNCLSCVLTFSPHPEKIFGSETISMIQTLDQRLEGIAGLGVDLILVAPFNSEFARLSGKDFVHKVLVKKLKARSVIVGPDFRFGKGRRGDIPALRKFGKRLWFDVLVVPPVRKKSLVVSSSAIRELLKLGHVGAAHQLLGRPYDIEGDVVRGEARGRILGFPTANIETPNEIIPKGVFVSLVDIGGKSRRSLTNVGSRPTFPSDPGAARPFTIEAHILDFKKNIYGAAIKLFFIKKIRDERTFHDAAGLAARIRKDLEDARRYFEKNEISSLRNMI